MNGSYFDADVAIIGIGPTGGDPLAPCVSIVGVHDVHITRRIFGNCTRH
jgi:hypothetical protein